MACTTFVLLSSWDCLSAGRFTSRMCRRLFQCLPPSKQELHRVVLASSELQHPQLHSAVFNLGESLYAGRVDRVSAALRFAETQTLVVTFDYSTSDCVGVAPPDDYLKQHGIKVTVPPEKRVQANGTRCKGYVEKSSKGKGGAAPRVDDGAAVSVRRQGAGRPTAQHGAPPPGAVLDDGQLDGRSGRGSRGGRGGRGASRGRRPMAPQLTGGGLGPRMKHTPVTPAGPASAGARPSASGGRGDSPGGDTDMARQHGDDAYGDGADEVDVPSQPTPSSGVSSHSEDRGSRKRSRGGGAAAMPATPALPEQGSHNGALPRPAPHCGAAATTGATALTAGSETLKTLSLATRMYHRAYAELELELKRLPSDKRREALKRLDSLKDCVDIMLIQLEKALQ